MAFDFLQLGSLVFGTLIGYKLGMIDVFGWDKIKQKQKADALLKDQKLKEEFLRWKQQRGDK
jgi:hypothetical protein